MSHRPEQCHVQGELHKSLNDGDFVEVRPAATLCEAREIPARAARGLSGRRVTKLPSHLTGHVGGDNLTRTSRYAARSTPAAS